MIESLLNLIQQNTEWAVGIVFVVALLESVAIVGLLIPGWLLLVGVGGLIGGDVLPFYPIVIAAYFGAVIGEYFSYWLGYHYHQPILAWKFVARHQGLIDKSRQFFHRHGISGVFIGRFFGPTRAVVPFIAGVAGMRQITFFWVNMISGLFWAPLYLIPGILVGAAVTLDESVGNYLIGILVLVSIAATVAWNYSKLAWVNWRKPAMRGMALFKAGLSWSIFLLTLVIFMRSIYWPMLGKILDVLVSKVS
jgi:membrane protein DedA with SNARE-associated domain